MLGIMVIIMDKMVQEYKENNKKKQNVNLKILRLILVLFFIVVIFVWISLKNNTQDSFIYSKDLVDPKVVMEEVSDGPIYDFVINYFDDRINMRFENIFNAFGKVMSDSFSSSKEKQIINNIINERTYIMSYNDIRVYKLDGLNKDENVLIITYDIKFSFSQSKAPSILLAYTKMKDGRYYFLDDFDIGISKFINSILKLNDVQILYESIKTKLDKALMGSEELKLIYNSYRQYNPNDDNTMKMDFSVDKIEMLDPITNNNQIIEFIDSEQNKKNLEISTKSAVDAIFKVR